jgi:hypothetical protein
MIESFTDHLAVFDQYRADRHFAQGGGLTGERERVAHKLFICRRQVSTHRGHFSAKAKHKHWRAFSAQNARKLRSLLGF